MEARESTREVWARWQGHIINGVFPLERYLGCSDHSGVFVTRSTALSASDLAVKLVPTNRILAASQLPRWKKALGLSHPHLLRLLEGGGCQLDGSPHLYAVMEYADQTLAQLLQHRTLTDDEAREMLPPILEALEYLHSQNLVQGQLKPANVLVVGDQLKLASDTLRRVGDGTARNSVYDPPEAAHGSSATADDIWALGVSLFEALTGHTPEGLGESVDTVLLADFSPAFRDLVARCLSSRPEDRPAATEILAWARGRSANLAPATAVQPDPMAPTITRPTEPTAAPATTQPTEPTAAVPTAPLTTAPIVPPTAAPTPTPIVPPTAPPLAAPQAPPPSPSMAPPSKPRSLPGLLLGALAIVVLGWIGWRVLTADRAPPAAPLQVPAESPPPTPTAAAPSAAQTPAPPVAAASTAEPSANASDPSKAALHEVIPDVSPSARRTIRGHIKIWVRVMVEPDGSVFAAVPERGASSAYFQRLAVEAAKKWTFPPADTSSRRVAQIQFDFSRDQTTGHAGTLR